MQDFIMPEDIHPACKKCITDRMARYGNNWNKLQCQYIKNDPLADIPKEMIASFSPEEKEDLLTTYDPVVFAKKYLGITARPEQEVMMKCTAERKVARIGRRAGKSHSLSMHAFHYAWTHEKKNLLFIAPLEGPLRELFMKFDEWIGDSDLLKAGIKRKKLTPLTLIFKNDSRIMGLSAGSKSGMGASNVRGQEADIIYLDEADYLDPKDIEAIWPLLVKTNENTDDKKMLWSCSTPTGKHQFFYDWCHDEAFKEFHYPSSINPNRTKENDIEDLKRLGQTGFDHEICFAKNTLIKTDRGDIPIQDVQIGDKVKDAITGDIQKISAGGHITRKETVTINIKTWSSNIQCTPDHMFLTPTGDKKKIEELSELSYRYSPLYNKDPNAILARIIGYVNGDGTITRRMYKGKKSHEYYQCSVYSKHKEDLDLLLTDYKQLYPNSNTNVTKKPCPGYDTMYYQIIFDSTFSKLLVDKGAVVGNKINQSFNVPKWIMKNNIYSTEYVAALWGAEGSTISFSKYRASYVPHSLVLSMVKSFKCSDIHLQDVKQIMGKLGVGVIQSQKDDMYNNQYRCNGYIWMMGSENIQQFEKKIGYRYCIQKEERLFEVAKYIDYLNAYTKDKIQKANRIYQEYISGEKTWEKLVQRYGFKSFKHIHKFVSSMRNTATHGPCGAMKFDEWITKYKINDFIIEPILSKKKINTRNVYNITVDSSTHSYIMADGVCTFNCAEFGEEMEGVYQHSYIDRGLNLSKVLIGSEGIWSYTKAIPIPGCVYTMGIDWNSSKNGVQIVIVEHNPSLRVEDDNLELKGRFRIATRVNIDAKDFTQTKAIDEIIRLNETWNPAYIFVDKGYGQVQYETLRKWGHSHPGTGLERKVEAIDSGSSMLTLDPITKNPEKKPVKPFMVNNSVRYFEENRILLNNSDDEFTKQLRDYVVEKRSRDGRPVYSADNDHILDAFNLAMLAFTMKFTDLGRAVYLSEMRVAGPMGQPNSPQRDIASMQLKKQEPKPCNMGVKPRDIQRDERSFFQARTFWDNNRYSTSRFNKPTKRASF